MCGILGMLTAENMGFYAADKDQFKNMLVMTSLRGIHSTGVFGVSKHKDNNDVSIVKSVGSPYSLFEFNKTDVFFSRMTATFGMVVGHSRYATKGAVDAPNAHPFKEGNITLVHNGVISNYHSLRDHSKHKDIEVDSQLIARLFAEEGALNVLPKIKGAYVLVWFDSDTGLLNIAKNDQRPLFFAEHAKKETLLFASEAETLMWNAARSKLEIEEITACPNFRLLQYEKDSLDCAVTPYKAEEIKSYWQGNKWEKAEPKEEKKQEYKETRKQQGTPDRIDELTVSMTEKNQILFQNQIVEFELHDYEFKDAYTIINGESSEFPNVEFYATGTNMIEEDLVACSAVRGNISAIHLVPPDKTFNQTRWRVFLTNFVLLFEHQNGSVVVPIDSKHTNENDIISSDDVVVEEYVQIKNTYNGEDRISKARLIELASCGCGWCAGVITKDELAKPSGLLTYDDGDTMSIICSGCASDTLDNLKAAAGFVH